MPGGVKNTGSELENASEAVLARAIAEMDGVDAGSVAGVLQALARGEAVGNLDAPVSNAGASIADIESGAEGALEEDIANLSPASNSVAANLDGGIAAVDWSSKTPKSESVNGVAGVFEDDATILSVTGSGYLTNATFRVDTEGYSHNAKLKIDGSVVSDRNMGAGSAGGNGERYNGSSRYGWAAYFDTIYRFESSFSFVVYNTYGSNQNIAAEAEYVLD